MTRTFLSPSERKVLASLPPKEAIFVKRCMDVFDAVLVGDGSGGRVVPAEGTRLTSVVLPGRASGDPSSASTAGAL
jgi:hypothetical protein